MSWGLIADLFGILGYPSPRTDNHSGERVLEVSSVWHLYQINPNESNQVCGRMSLQIRRNVLGSAAVETDNVMLNPFGPESLLNRLGVSLPGLVVITKNDDYLAL